MAVKAVFGLVIADFKHNIANELRNVYIAVCGNFAHYHYHARCCAAFASNARIRVIAQHCIKHGVRDIVADLVRMPSVTDSEVNSRFCTSLLFIFYPFHAFAKKNKMR